MLAEFQALIDSDPVVRMYLSEMIAQVVEVQELYAGADPVGFYQKPAAAVCFRSPLPAPGGGDTAPVTAGDLSTASLLYLSAPNFTPGYSPLAAAAAGNGAP